jgi:hypothetical protein
MNGRCAFEARIRELKAEGMGILKIGRTIGVGTSVVQRVIAAGWTFPDGAAPVPPQGRYSTRRYPPGAQTRLPAGSVDVASFVLCGCPIVASGAARMADIAIRFWDLMAISRDQKKLFPHFSEAGSAIFPVD